VESELEGWDVGGKDGRKRRKRRKRKKRGKRGVSEY